MKKILFLFLMLPLLVACGSDDDDDYTNSDIVGTWVLQSSIAKEVKTNSNEATQAIKDDIAIPNDSEVSYTFAADGKVTINEDDDIVSGTYSLSGNKLTMTIYGEKATVTISLSANTFSSDVDETEYYQDEIKYLLPKEKDVVVSKVITSYTYKRK